MQESLTTSFTKKRPLVNIQNSVFGKVMNMFKWVAEKR
jgi:hypothetical protein